VGLSLVSRKDAAGAACLNLGVFSFGASFPVASIGTKEIVVTDAGAALDGATGSIVVDTGTGADEVYTIASAVSGDGVTTITTVEDLDDVDVADTICRTAVPTADDDVTITHAIPGGAAIAFTCKDLDLSSAVANFATSVAPAGDITVGWDYTFTHGTKQIGLKGANPTPAVFGLHSDGSIGGGYTNIYGTSAHLPHMTDSFRGDGHIYYSGPVDVDVCDVDFCTQNFQVESAVRVTIASLASGKKLQALGPATAEVIAPIIVVGVAPADIRDGTAGGTLKVPPKSDVRQDVPTDDGVGTLDVAADNPPRNGARTRRGWL
jgi:hypothetical protein